MKPTIPVISAAFCFAATALLPVHAGVVSLDLIGDPAVYNTAAESVPSVSQIFSDFHPYDSMVLENFHVTSQTGLNVELVEVLFRAQGGFESFSLVTSFQLGIFSAAPDGTSLTGDVFSGDWLVSGGLVVVEQVGDGDVGLVKLTTDILLPSPGTYWVGVVATGSFAEAGTFHVQSDGKAGADGGKDGKFINPSEGFGVGAAVSTSSDFAYRVTTKVPEPATPLLLLGGMVVALGIRRRLSPNL